VVVEVRARFTLFSQLLHDLPLTSFCCCSSTLVHIAGLGRTDLFSPSSSS